MLGKILSEILISAILASITALGYMLASPKAGERFTEFYMLGPDGNAEGYPWDLKLGEEGAVILLIINHEYETMGYRVEIAVGKTLIKMVGPVELANGMERSGEVKFKASDLGPYQKVEFKLFRIRELGEGEEKHTGLSLWLSKQGSRLVVVNEASSDARHNIEVGAQDSEGQ